MTRTERLMMLWNQTLVDLCVGPYRRKHAPYLIRGSVSRQRGCCLGSCFRWNGTALDFGVDLVTTRLPKDSIASYCESAGNSQVRLTNGYLDGIPEMCAFLESERR